MVWKPRVVVASIIEQNGRYLMVEEQVQGKLVINQPAGHLEFGESIIDAVRRETLEETGYRFEPDGLLGMLLIENDDPDRVYLRFAFRGKAIEKVAGYQTDPDIIASHWLTEDEIRRHPRLTPRNDLVLNSIALYQQGVHLPLDAIHYLP